MMSINLKQLVDCVIEPTLKKVKLFSRDAVTLLLGTCAAESRLGTYLKQIEGPALGIYMMEPDTYYDIWYNFLKYRVQYIENYNLELLQDDIIVPPHEDLMCDLRLATFMARIHYLRVKQPIPSRLEEQAQYWKKYYNTYKGKGTVNGYISNYMRLVEWP